jgi:hypothetical protein
VATLSRNILLMEWSRTSSQLYPDFARNSSFVFKGRTIGIKQVGSELGVRYVLEGSVRRLGQRVRITGQLIDTQTGAHQDRISTSVVGAIAPKLVEIATDATDRKPINNWLAYDYYLKGTQLFHIGLLTSALEAQGFFRKAQKLDPNLHLAAARFASTVQTIRDLHNQPISEADRLEAISLAERALSMAQDDEVVLSFSVHWNACG